MWASSPGKAPSSAAVASIAPLRARQASTSDVGLPPGTAGAFHQTRLRLEPSSLRASRGLTKVIVAIFTDGAKLARVGAMVPSGAGELMRTAREPWHAPAVSVMLAFRNTAFTAGPNADFQGGNQSQPPPQPPQPPPPPPPPPPPQSKGNFQCEGAVFTGSGNTQPPPIGSKRGGSQIDGGVFHMGSCQLFELT
jgi:hypothetical protein